MSTLAGQSIVIIGGTSGLGYAAALASLTTDQASSVTVASSTAAKVQSALERLEKDARSKGAKGEIKGEVLNLKDNGAVKAFFQKVGEIDHLILSAGDIIFPLQHIKDIDFDNVKSTFDVRFWGTVHAAQQAKVRPGGSITFTIGTSVVKPFPKMTIAGALTGAIDAVVRALAVDLAPIRVNCISPGAVNTELWDIMPAAAKEAFLKKTAQTLLVKHVAEPEEIAEAYLFAMKCKYLTGKRIEVDGGTFLSNRAAFAE